MEDVNTIRRNVAQQREWYGEPLGDRVRRLVVAFDVSQGQLADALGISRPMLSQLMSGRRAKIGNPVVLARMMMLEHRVLTPGVASGDPTSIRLALEEVRHSRPTVGRSTIDIDERTDDSEDTRGDGGEPGREQYALPALRRAAGPDELEEAADTLDRRFPQLAGLLRRAAQDEWPATSARTAPGTGPCRSPRSARPTAREAMGE